MSGGGRDRLGAAFVAGAAWYRYCALEEYSRGFKGDLDSERTAMESLFAFVRDEDPNDVCPSDYDIAKGEANVPELPSPEDELSRFRDCTTDHWAGIVDDVVRGAAPTVRSMKLPNGAVQYRISFGAAQDDRWLAIDDETLDLIIDERLRHRGPSKSPSWISPGVAAEIRIAVEEGLAAALRGPAAFRALRSHLADLLRGGERGGNAQGHPGASGAHPVAETPNG